MTSSTLKCPTLFKSLLFAALIASLGDGLALAQAPSRPDRGTMPNRIYAVSDIENISLSNGNVNLSIPLAALPPIAGGKLSWVVSANYNSKMWDVTRSQQNGDALTWQPFYVDLPQSAGGWTIGGRYSIYFRNANEDFSRLTYPSNSGLPFQELQLLNNNQWRKVVLFMPDGSQHELRPIDAAPYPGTQDFLRGFYNVLPNGTPLGYYSVDGSYLFAKISGAQDWTIFLPDGTRVVQTSDGVQRVQDTNGNSIKIYDDTNGSHYQDEQTGREVRITYDPAANGGMGQTRVWYVTVTGLQQHIDINHGFTQVQGQVYQVNDWLPSGSETGGGSVCQRSEQLNLNLYVVREIVMPQTEPGQVARKFAFSYNSDDSQSATDQVQPSCGGPWQGLTRTVSKGWGELSRMVTPAGAVVDYRYTLDSVHSLVGSSTDAISQQSVIEKKITHDGGTIDVWSYSITDTISQMSGPDGSSASEVKYCSLPNTPGCATDKAGLVYRSVRPFTTVERHWTTLQFAGANIDAPGGVLAFNAVVDKEYTTLTDTQGNKLKMSAKFSSFDYNGNVVQETFYDWFDPNGVQRDAVGVPTGVPGGATILKVVNYSHYNQAASATSANVYAKRSVSTGAPLILNALQQTTLGASNVQLSYDNQAYGVAPTVGNLTTKKVWDDLDSKWITTSTSYGLYGNVSTATDGRGKVMQFFYDDATHALPTRVIVDPQNGTGTQTTTTAYDYSTGLVTSQTDVNGQISTIDYTNQLLGSVDPFGRPGITKASSINIGGTNQQRRVTTTYRDSARQVVVATDLFAENDQLLKTRTTTDQLGRPTLTEQTENGTDYSISATTAYLNMGRVTLTSSARRSTTATTDSWTRVTKDAAGRVTEVATFGGPTQPAWTNTTGVFTGAVTTAYDAQFTTVTDQAGKVRRSMVDGIGRLVEVDEPDANGSLGSNTAPAQPTSYGYDVLGNLTSVTQGLQTRSFTYDSLSRLRTAINPESGSIGYQYDDNGNLLVKTDARGVSAHFDYDSLNRVTHRWYNGSSATTATSHNSPALPSGVGATDEVRFYYDTQALPAGAPSYTRGSAVGRLVAQVYGSGSNGDYYAYDVLGRQTLKYQQTGTINYLVSASYSLSGAITALTYPSGHTVTNAYDNAGRLTTLSGNLGDGTTRTYTSAILYSPVGGLVKEKFGTATPVYNKLFYNSRGQLAEIRESTTYTPPPNTTDPANITDTTWNRGAIINHYSNQCWGMCSGSSMSDNNGNLQKQEVYIPNDDQISSYTMRWQQYDYDSLNRLNWVREIKDNVEQWKQQFTYDRWGNRTINTAVTYGVGINNKSFAVAPCATPSDPCSNRLLVPAGQSGTMTYDAAGNLTNDTYTGAGSRTYDAENKITSAWGGNNQAQLYAYDASGQRIKRTVNGVETWQVYGFGGELLAEYPANVTPTSPQKEYGYRNGHLLITADGAPAQSIGSTPNAATFVSQQVPQTMVAGHHYAVSVTFRNSGSNTWTTANHYNLGVANDNGVWGLYRVALPNSVAPNQEVTFNFTVTAPATPANYNFQWRVVQDYVEWFGDYSTNVQIAVSGAGGNGGNAAECTWQNVPATMVAGQSYTLTVKMLNSGTNTWTTANHYNLGSANDNGAWGLYRVALPSSIAPNQEATFTFAVTAPTTPGNYTFQWRMVQDYVEWFGDTSTNVSVTVTAQTVSQVHWLVTDHLGTTRMVLDQGGALANVKRHDYLPFGEELFAPTGGRTATQGYTSDDVRQHFTAKERDVETGLDYFEARYYASAQGRFTRPDPYNIILESQASAELDADKARAQFANYLNHPQNWDRYGFVINNPLKYVDPTGEELWLTGTQEERARELERIKNLVGKDAAKYLTTTEVSTSGGTVTVVGYTSNAFAKYEKDVTTRLANIIDSKDVVEYHIAETFQSKYGTRRTEDYGGAATVGKEESLNGHTQIFVNPKASDIAQDRLGVPSILAGSRSSNGRPLDFYDDIVDFHEFGHAYANTIDNSPINSDQSNWRAREFENIIRQRRGLSNRRAIE